MSCLYVLNVNTFEREKIDIPMGVTVGLGFHPKGDALVLTITTPKTAGDAFLIYLKDRKLENWTQSEVGGINTDKFVIPSLIHFDTFDDDPSMNCVCVVCD